MREGAVLSAGMHVTLIVLAIVGLPHFFQPDPIELMQVPVEVVTVDQLAETPQKPVEQPKPEPKAPPPPPPMPAPPEPVRTEPPPPEPVKPPEPAKAEPPKPEPAPPKPEVAETPKPKPKAEPKPEPKPEPVKPPEVKRPEIAAAPKRKPTPPPDAFQSLLKDLAAQNRKRQAEAQKEEKAEEQPQVTLNVPRPQQPERSAIDTRRIAATLQQLVAQQISPCWGIPAGAKDVQDMRVAVRIGLNPDGSLRGVPMPDDVARINSDPIYRTVAESALRALRNPRCTPLRLPLQHYDMWKDITFIFDPKEMVGQ